jgi:hypothetical protein
MGLHVVTKGAILQGSDKGLAQSEHRESLIKTAKWHQSGVWI